MVGVSVRVTVPLTVGSIETEVVCEALGEPVLELEAVMLTVKTLTVRERVEEKVASAVPEGLAP